MNELAYISQLQQRIALYEDMKAYKSLYELLFPQLFRFSLSFVKSREAAEEIVSDAFLKIWIIRTDLTSVENLKVYLYTITKNFSLNYITKHFKYKVISIEDVKEELLFNFSTPEDAINSSDIINKINQSINGLPSQCKVIFYLVKECDMKYKDVSTILNVSVNTVRNQVAIATKKIAASLPVSIKRDFSILSRFSES